MTSIVSGILIASLLFIQGIGGSAGIGGKAGIGGSLPKPPPAYFNSTQNSVGSASTLSDAITGVNAGDFLAIWFVWYANDSPTSGPTDSAGTLVPALSSHPVVWDGTARSVDLYCEANASSGTHTISIGFGSNRLIGIVVSEYSGASTSACTQGGGGSLDGAPTSNVITTTTNPSNCGAITTTQGNDTIFTGEIITVGSVGAGSGYTVRQSLLSNLAGVQDGPITLAGATTPTFAAATGHPAVCLAMAIKHV